MFDLGSYSIPLKDTPLCFPSSTLSLCRNATLAASATMLTFDPSFAQHL